MATIHESHLALPVASTDDGRSNGSRRLRWTSEEYYKLAELGFFRNRRVELVDGNIIAMSGFKPPHAIAIELADGTLRSSFGGGFRVRIQLPIDLGRRSQPEPDVLVIAGSPRDSAEHPTTALLVMEISDTTLRYDRLVKGHVYARAGLRDYWILNLFDRTLEVHRLPGPDPARPGRFAYAQRTIIPADGQVSPLARPEIAIAVADLLP